MKYLNYIDTKDPFMKPINEGRGVPNVLKEILDILFKKALESIKNPSPISMDFSYQNFNVKNLYLSFKNVKRNEIYAYATFGIYSLGYLKSPSINIELDFSNFSELDLKRVILHELLHIYEVFNRIKGGTKRDIQWGLGKSLMNIRDKYRGDRFISDLIYLIYISLDHEINSRVCETYIILMELKSSDRKILIEELEKSSAWKYKNYLRDFKTDNYDIDVERLSDFLRDLSQNILKKYSINFNLYKNPSVGNWISLFRKKSRYFENKLMKLIDEVVNDIEMISTSYVDIGDGNLSERYFTRFDPILWELSKNFKRNRDY
jgi:hypothetical protein